MAGCALLLPGYQARYITNGTSWAGSDNFHSKIRSNKTNRRRDAILLPGVWLVQTWGAHREVVVCGTRAVRTPRT